MLNPRLAVVAAFAVLVLTYGLALGQYWLSYFPYEDDFSLIRYSAVENNPSAVDWVRKGFTEYFANDPFCAMGGWGFSRPVVNFSHYVESLLSPRAQGIRLMVTNLAVWLISVGLLYGIARRLGVSAWMAAMGIVLFGVSPCWSRVLLHSSFRNNGLAACFILAAFFVLLGETTLRSKGRLLLVGLLAALSVASHEQGLTNLPVLALCLLWFYWQNRRAVSVGKAALSLALVLFPSILLHLLFRSLAISKGTNYAADAFVEMVSRSSRLEAIGITNPLAIRLIKLLGQVVRALLGAPMAFTPSGADNLAVTTPLWGLSIFLLAALTGFMTRKYWPRWSFVWMILMLYALGRNLAGFSEPRFTHLEVAWAVLALVGAISAIPASTNPRLALVTGAAAVFGLLAFNLISLKATILDHRSELLQREFADRASFEKIAEVGARFPNAKFVFANEQTGMWSALPMVDMARRKPGLNEFLPTINSAWSTDFLQESSSCPVTTDVVSNGDEAELVMTYPAKCKAYTYGRNLECTAAQYQDKGLAHAAQWAVCAAPGKGGGDCGAVIRHEIRRVPGEQVVVFHWKSRLAIAEATVLPVVPVSK